jgi:hypothetical protein
VRRAHPVLAAAAEPTLPARDDLLGYDPVAGIDIPPVTPEIIDGDDFADELVAGGHQQVDIRRDGPVTPVHRRPVKALEVARADPDGLYLHQGFTGSGGRRGKLLDAVVLATVDHDRLHGRTHPKLLVNRRLRSMAALVVTSVSVVFGENKVPSFCTAAAPH